MKLPKITDIFIGLCVVLSIQGFVFVFLLYVPTINDITVHKVDKPMLASAKQVAQNAAIIAAFSSFLLTLALNWLWKRSKRKKTESTSASSTSRPMNRC